MKTYKINCVYWAYRKYLSVHTWIGETFLPKLTKLCVIFLFYFLCCFFFFLLPWFCRVVFFLFTSFRLKDEEWKSLKKTKAKQCINIVLWTEIVLDLYSFESSLWDTTFWRKGSKLNCKYAVSRYWSTQC